MIPWDGAGMTNSWPVCSRLTSAMLLRTAIVSTVAPYCFAKAVKVSPLCTKHGWPIHRVSIVLVFLATMRATVEVRKILPEKNGKKKQWSFRYLLLHRMKTNSRGRWSVLTDGVYSLSPCSSYSVYFPTKTLSSSWWGSLIPTTSVVTTRSAYVQKNSSFSTRRQYSSCGRTSSLLDDAPASSNLRGMIKCRVWWYMPGRGPRTRCSSCCLQVSPARGALC